jgi:hypothetical protein
LLRFADPASIPHAIKETSSSKAGTKIEEKPFWAGYNSKKGDLKIRKPLRLNQRFLFGAIG